ncbi:Short transient receptor putative channel 4 [Desmophyllum pertusum]|uniref:Short transient receptor putative channel 4 n=1 Tax=Desmophyllum pertusum TaxID=174260 RepID=A0A9W9YZF8_9CNID|nr:Short transient receptor putative channel 4 [Desmophyllum pertusum]
MYICLSTGIRIALAVGLQGSVGPSLVAILKCIGMVFYDHYPQANLDTEWKFTRTKLWLSWVYKKSIHPPPFNLLYLLLPFLWVMKRLMTACCSKRVLLFFKHFFKKKPKSTWKVKRIDENERRDVIRHLILRNLAKKSYDLESGAESASDSDAEEDNEVSSATNGLENGQSNEDITMETAKL